MKESALIVLWLFFTAGQLLLSRAQEAPSVSSSFPAVQPSLTQARIQGGKFAFVLNGRADGKYVIERSQGLVNWIAASTNSVPATGSTNIELQLATNRGGVFYRAREDTSSVLFMDGFDRSDSPAVGGSWSESDQSNLLSINSGALRLSSNADRSAYIRAAGVTNQLGVKVSFTFYIAARNGHEVLQVGTRAGGTTDSEYRDCFGFAILPAYGVQPNDTALQGQLTPFTFKEKTIYEVEMLLFTDTSRELRVWQSGTSRPAFPTVFTTAQTRTTATGQKYQIGFDAGSSEFTDILMGEFRVEPIPAANSGGTKFILADSFERADSANVGGSWEETDPSNVLSIRSGTLRLNSNADRYGYLLAAGRDQLGVIISFSLEIKVMSGKEVIQVGTRGGGGGGDNPYRDCFGFAILPGAGVIPNDTTFQGAITPFTFSAGNKYQVELVVFSDNSRELRVWPAAGSRPSIATAFAPAQLKILASGSKYQIGFDAGSSLASDISIDDVRIQQATSGTSSTLLLVDTFDRVNSPTVGGSWTESDPDEIFSVQSGSLRMSSTQDTAANLRAAGTLQFGVKITFQFTIVSRNNTEVIQVGTRAGGGGERPYRDCFGFAILPGFGVQANDTILQGTVTPFSFQVGTVYRVEMAIAQNNSRELRVWPSGTLRPVTPTLAIGAQLIVRAVGSNYQIGFDSGSSGATDCRIDDFRVEKLVN